MPPDEQIPLGLTVSPETEPLSFDAASGREEPAVWVQKVGVYKNWPPSQETLLRQVFELRRGLNILWAQPNGSTEESSRLAGHGAGKTTFCRLLRYVVGEDSAGNKEFREGFRDKFDNGWVLAEVFVGGKRWLVGRPLSGSGYHPFAKLGGALTDEFPDSPSNTGFKEYEAAIDQAVFCGMKVRTLADSRKKLDWSHLLPWLSRDQEAHFSGLLEWRHQDSDHGSPKTSQDDKANLIRLTLGLVDEDEQQLLTLFAKKATEHEEKVRDRPKMEFTVERERQTLEATIKIAVESPDQPLLQHAVDQLVNQLRDETDQALATVKHDEEMDVLITEMSQRKAEWGLMSVQIEDAEDALADLDAKVTNSQPPKMREANPFRETLNGMGPFRGYCSHPMTEAWKAQCPIAHERPKQDEVTQAVKEIVAEVQPQVARIAAMKADLTRLRQAGVPRKAALDLAMKNLAAARERHRKELEKMKGPGKEAARIEALLTSYRTACTELDQWDKDLASLKKDKEDLDADIDKLVKHHQKLVEQFSRIFDHIAKRMLGEAVTGRVRIKGKALVPELEYHGLRNSAAYKVVRWLIFDLASLALGMTTAAAHHPRFLIHDSPRESDLAAAIYTSLFSTAQELEGNSGELAAFQYIVTTTEAPGEAVNKKPWVLYPVLDASTENGRLLGVDI